MTCGKQEVPAAYIMLLLVSYDMSVGMAAKLWHYFPRLDTPESSDIVVSH